MKLAHSVALVSIFLVTPVFAEEGAPLYANAQYFVGDSPEGLATGDFDHDGRLDLVTANALSGDVSVLLANGAGAFRPEVRYFAGPGARSVAVGDLDEDGVLDLAVACSGLDSVVILLGTPAGGFGPPLAHPTGTTPCAVALGDLDRDGHLDVASADYSSGGPGTVSVLFGNGQASLGAPNSYAVYGHGPRTVVLGDFSGDGWLDLAVGSSASSALSVLIRHQSGTFGPATSLFAAPNVRSLSTSDLNSDGKLDLACAGEGSYGVEVYYGNGSGGFQGPVSFALGGANARSVATGDLNQDGRMDLLGMCANPPRLRLRYGTTIGSLAGGPAVAIAGDSAVTVLGDFDQDGIVDVASVSQWDDLVSVFVRKADGEFAAIPKVSMGAGRVSSMVSADFDGDGKADIAVARYNANEVTLVFGDGNGSWIAGTEAHLPVGAGPLGILARDLDLDGWTDIVVANAYSHSVSILHNLGSGNFASAVHLPVGGLFPREIVIADLDGNGWPDIASSNATTSDVSVFLGIGQGAFAAGVPYTTDYGPNGIAVGHLDSDSNLDLVTSNGADTIFVLKGDGMGAFQVSDILPTTPKAFGIAVADLNSDGRDDVVALTGNLPGVSGGIDVFFQDAQGSLYAGGRYLSGMGVLPLAIGDLNGDGSIDVVVPNSISNDVTLFLNNGQGDFSQRVSHVIARIEYCTSDPAAIALADLDLDGRLDIVTGGYCYEFVGDRVSVLLNQWTDAPGIAACAGDGIAGLCPCANSGLQGRGCENSVASGGALLSSSGKASLALDSLVLTSSGELPSSLSIFLQGSSFVPHVGFGDGLRCAGGMLLRLYVQNAFDGTASAPLGGTTSVSARSAALGDPLVPGHIRIYQTFYRDPDLAFCPTGNSFNVSSAQQVVWAP